MQNLWRVLAGLVLSGWLFISGVPVATGLHVLVDHAVESHHDDHRPAAPGGDGPGDDPADHRHAPPTLKVTVLTRVSGTADQLLLQSLPVPVWHPPIGQRLEVVAAPPRYPLSVPLERNSILLI